MTIKLLVAAASTAVLMASGLALAQGNSQNAPGQDRVCLITFNKAGTARNVDLTCAKILPRTAAQAQVNDTTKIYEYGPNGSLTQEACACLDNPATRANCSQPVMR